MRMLTDVNKHTVPDLELRVRHGKRLVKEAIKRANEARKYGELHTSRMHQGYGLYIQRCIDQAQQELDRRKS